MIRNIPLLRQWVAALRGGKYHQTKNVLCKIDKGQSFHCCLGVACRVMAKNGVVIDTVHHGNGIKFDGDHETLTEKLRDKLSIREEEADDLAMMNDAGKSFREIADHIERNIINEA